jgi:type IV secretion system protein TrbL
MLRPMCGVAQKFLLGLIALVCWPFGWVMAAVVTNAMLDAAAAANLVPVINVGAPLAAPALTVLLVGSWMLISSVLAPWITTKILLMGANPAAAFAQGVGGVMQSAFSGGVGAAVTAATGGAAAPAVIAAAAAGALSSGSESAARGGGSARSASTVIGGLSGLYSGSFMRRNAAAAETTASSQRRRADASEAFAAEFSEHVRRRRRSRSGFDSQPHHEDPNQAAIDIDSHAKS